MLLLFAALSALAGTLDRAVEARLAGDYAGAAAFLDTVRPLIDAEEVGQWNLERGLAEDLSWRPEAAEPYFREAIAAGDGVALEARYHLVVVLDDLGRVSEAQAELAALRSTPVLDPSFRAPLKVQEGVLAIHAGRTTKGVRLVRQGLRGINDEERHSWMIGRGRYALLDAEADRAEALRLDVAERKQVRNLKARVRALRAVESELFKVIATEEPEWITSALLRVGSTYAALADDLGNAQPPRGLRGEQIEVYRQAVREKAEAPRTKAFDIYDKGVAVAARLNWESPVVEELRQRRDELAALR